MSKVFIQEDTLTNIANAIREKDGTTDPIAPQNMADAIINLPSGEEVEPIVLTDDCSYFFYGPIAGKYVELFGNMISTSNITNCEYMFKKYPNDTIPFDINCVDNQTVSLQEMFYESKIKRAPRIINLKRMSYIYRLFSNCHYLREISDDFCDTWDWSYFHGTGTLPGYYFHYCSSLRKISANFLKNCYNQSINMYQGYFYGATSLDEINGLVVSPMSISSSNYFRDTFGSCFRLKDLLFETNEDGTAKTANWKSQTISLQYGIGYVSNTSNINAPHISNILNYNSGITADKQVSDDTTYQALKDDPDWFSADINYSRYNHDSAVKTINSLPDTSAYLASNGGTNTITFKGASGALTDGGAINTLTEEEIAVATVKGWTVSFV